MVKRLFFFSTLLIIFIIPSSKLFSQSMSWPGSIKGDNVYLRSDHTTQSKALATLSRGQSINIISSYAPSGNNNEAILRAKTDFYDETYGVKMFTLDRGKAVKVSRRQNDKYLISFRNDNTGSVGYAQIETNRLEFIGGETWYYVEVNNKTGWVFGKYVQSYNDGY